MKIRHLLAALALVNACTDQESTNKEKTYDRAALLRAMEPNEEELKQAIAAEASNLPQTPQVSSASLKKALALSRHSIYGD